MSATERAAIEAALGSWFGASWRNYARTNPDTAEIRRVEMLAAIAAYVASGGRELLAATPTLPPEPPPGFVRARFPIAVGADGQWCVSAASHDQESESIEATDWFRREGHPSRVSFATVDAPLPTSPAEITGVVTP